MPTNMELEELGQKSKTKATSSKEKTPTSKQKSVSFAKQDVGRSSSKGSESQRGKTFLRGPGDSSNTDSAQDSRDTSQTGGANLKKLATHHELSQDAEPPMTGIAKAIRELADEAKRMRAIQPKWRTSSSIDESLAEKVAAYEYHRETLTNQATSKEIGGKPKVVNMPINHGKVKLTKIGPDSYKELQMNETIVWMRSTKEPFVKDDDELFKWYIRLWDGNLVEIYSPNEEAIRQSMFTYGFKFLSDHQAVTESNFLCNRPFLNQNYAFDLLVWSPIIDPETGQVFQRNQHIVCKPLYAPTGTGEGVDIETLQVMMLPDFARGVKPEERESVE